MSDQLLHLNIRGPIRRGLTLLPLILALTGAWFSVRWFIGNTIAENLNPDDRGLENAQMAAGLAPSDPLAHWTLAELEQRKLTADQSSKALAEYDKAVRLSPNDYRFWLAWGRALEQLGETKKSEQAMRQAIALAPSYSNPRWYLGNLLVRDGRDEEAFAELRPAGEADPQLRPQIFNLLWQVYQNNPSQLSVAVGSAPETRAEFAKYLVQSGQLDAGLGIWQSLSADDKQKNRVVGDSLVKVLLDGKHFGRGLEIWNGIALREALRGKVGEILDGDFERKADPENSSFFNWQIKSGQQVQASFDDDVKHSGKQSLRLVFKARSNVEIMVAQLVVVEPNTQYDFEGYVKTSDLKSAVTPVIEIVSATTGAILITSPQAPTGFVEWQKLALTFKTDSRTEGVFIRVSRGSCEDNNLCPIFGTLWYDNFTIKRRS
jgi:tetratricopeptide (TPR) repeat protein